MASIGRPDAKGQQNHHEVLLKKTVLPITQNLGLSNLPHNLILMEWYTNCKISSLLFAIEQFDLNLCFHLI